MLYLLHADLKQSTQLLSIIYRDYVEPFRPARVPRDVRDSVFQRRSRKWETEPRGQLAALELSRLA